MNKENVTSFVHSHQHVTALCVICLLTVCAFLPTFWNGFQMEWDDQWMVMNPLTVLYINWSSVVKIFCTPFNGQWAPFNQMLYTLLYNIFEYNPLPYHAASLIMHLVNVCLVYSITRDLLHDCTKIEISRQQASIVIATAIFAVHPLQVEAVAWISASKILMSSTFYLLATYSFIKYLKQGKYIYYFIALLLFFCSYLSKENVMTFPLWTSLLSHMYGRKLFKRNFWLINIPIYLLTLVMSLHLIFYVAGYNDYIQGDVYPLGMRILLCFYSLFNYLYYWMLPFHLDWMYSYPVGLHESLPWWLFLYPLLLLVVICMAWERIKGCAAVYMLLFFFVHLLFVIHLIVLPRGGVIADRYMYLPILGLNSLFAYYMTALPWSVAHRRFSYGMFAAILLLLSVLTYERTSDWLDSRTLKREIVGQCAMRQYKMPAFSAYY